MTAPAKCPECEGELVLSAVPSLGSYCPKGCGYQDGDRFRPSTNGDGNGNDPLDVALGIAVVESEQPSAKDVREVLDALHKFLSRFLVMSDDGLRVLAVWTFHTWAFEASETTPYVSIRSPER